MEEFKKVLEELKKTVSMISSSLFKEIDLLIEGDNVFLRKKGAAFLY